MLAHFPEFMTPLPPLVGSGYYIGLCSNLKHCARGGRGVINSGKWANVVYGWPIIGSDTSSVASRARTELTSSKCD